MTGLDELSVEQSLLDQRHIRKQPGRVISAPAFLYAYPHNKSVEIEMAYEYICLHNWDNKEYFRVAANMATRVPDGGLKEMVLATSYKPSEIYRIAICRITFYTSELRFYRSDRTPYKKRRANNGVEPLSIGRTWDYKRVRGWNKNLAPLVWEKVAADDVDHNDVAHFFVRRR